MIKLALAIGFLAVFGIVAVAIIHILKETKKDKETLTKKHDDKH